MLLAAFGFLGLLVFGSSIAEGDYEEAGWFLVVVLLLVGFLYLFL